MNDLVKNAREQYYEIVIQGILDERWMRWFDGMQRAALPEGRTRLSGCPVDQSALFGMLTRIRDLGFPLLLVRRGDVELNLNDLNQIDQNKNEEK